MKKHTALLLFILAFTACKSTKNTTNTGVDVKNMSAKKIAKKHISSTFDKKTVDAKLKVKFKNNTETQNFSVSLKIKKDEVIWLKGTKIISIFKAKITPTSVSYYSPYFKDYFEGDYSLIKEFLGTDITFNELQNIFLGQAKIEDGGKNYTVENANNAYVLTPENQQNLFDVFLHINPDNFKLQKHSLVNSLKNQRLDIEYPKYLKKDGEFFPENIHLMVKDKDKFTDLDISVKSVNFNGNLSMPFSIPSGYKKLEF